MSVLDRMAYHALTSRQAHLAQGSGLARCYRPDVEPFGACANDGAEALRDLAALVDEFGSLVLLQAGKPKIPASVAIAFEREGLQMINEELPPAADTTNVTELNASDADDMLDLANLTKPGPFLRNTYMLGGFIGLRVEGKLIAMAGERFKVDGFTEISGVCTHPDHRGRGLAARLSTLVAHRIVVRGETPMLHVIASNTAAIKLYENLGFRLRCPVTAIHLKRG